MPRSYGTQPRASQSQRRRPSPSQRQPSQSQRPSRGRARVEEEEEEEADEGDVDEEVEPDGDDVMDVDGTGAGDDVEERRANDLARLALFAEHRRIPLRREEISKKVLGSASRSFNLVFARANNILQRNFGFELVELSRHAREEEEEDNTKSKKGKEKDPEENPNVRKKKAANLGTKTYILRSTLDPALIAMANEPDDEILRAERQDLNDRSASDLIAPIEEDEPPSGTLLSWTHDTVGDSALGILHVVLALILVNGRVINDMDLRHQLRRLRLDSSAHVDLGTGTPTRTITLDAYFGQLVRQGYLDKLKIGEAGAKQTGVKRTRGGATQTQAPAEDHNTVFEWKWGPRAASEIGEHGVALFVAQFMAMMNERSRADDVEQENSDSETGERANAADRRKRAAAKEKRIADDVKRVMTGVERAAGGRLAEVR